MLAKTHLESRCCAILIYNVWLPIYFRYKLDMSVIETLSSTLSPAPHTARDTTQESTESEYTAMSSENADPPLFLGHDGNTTDSSSTGYVIHKF